MELLEDEVDELSLDSQPPQPLMTLPNLNSRTKERVRFSRGIPESTMSSSRYPKRRRVSGREKEPTPPPQPTLPAPAEQIQGQRRDVLIGKRLCPASTKL